MNSSGSGGSVVILDMCQLEGGIADKLITESYVTHTQTDREIDKRSE